MSLRLSLSSTGTLVLELPGPGGSVSFKQLPFLKESLGDSPADILNLEHCNSGTLLCLIAALEAQNRGGPIQPWMDHTKPVPAMTKLEAHGRARPPSNPWSEADRRRVLNLGPTTIKSLDELFSEEDPQ